MKKFLLLLFPLLLTACSATQRQPSTEIAPPTLQAPVSATPARMLHNASDPNGGSKALYSPDGSKIAFISSTRHTPADLWVMNADGSSARRLTSRGVNTFRWSRAGDAIMFTANRKGFGEVLTIDPMGKQEERMAGLPPNASIPAYSPDGNFFAFVAPDKGGVAGLWIGTADGKRIEPVTDKISVRSFFWDRESRRIYYEAGKQYGVGLWMIDLATMENRNLVNKYIGTPVYSASSDRIAFTYPTEPGVFEIHVIKPDGSDERIHKAPRLQGRSLSWDADGKGLYYVAQDFVKEGEQKKPEITQLPAEAAPHKSTAEKAARTEILSLWRLDLASGAEQRVTPENFQLLEYSISPDGKTILCGGLEEKSIGMGIFSLDTASGGLKPLAKGRYSEWKPVPSHDSTRIAFFTNEVDGIDTLRIISSAGEELASYPGLSQDLQSHLFWLPKADGLGFSSGDEMWAFSEKESVQFAKGIQFRAILYANTSIQEDKILVSAIPQYGQTPGLYMLENVAGTMQLKDFRYPPPPEIPSEVYLQPRWSLDGKRIAFSDGIDIWVMNGDGSGRTWITNHAENNRDGKGKPSLATFPIWSSRGDRICYTLTVYDGKKVLRQIWVINADGKENRMLYSEEVDSAFQAHIAEFTNQPAFDYNDEWVIFTTVEEGVPNVAAVRINDGKFQRLTEKGAIYPSLLPEDALIVYISLENNNERLWVMNNDGSDKRPLAVKLKPAVAKPAVEKPAANPAATDGNKGGEAAKKPEAPAPEAAKAAPQPAGKVATKDVKKGKKKPVRKKK